MDGSELQMIYMKYYCVGREPSDSNVISAFERGEGLKLSLSVNFAGVSRSEVVLAFALFTVTRVRKQLIARAHG